MSLWTLGTSWHTYTYLCSFLLFNSQTGAISLFTLSVLGVLYSKSKRLPYITQVLGVQFSFPLPNLIIQRLFLNNDLILQLLDEAHNLMLLKLSPKRTVLTEWYSLVVRLCCCWGWRASVSSFQSCPDSCFVLLLKRTAQSVFPWLRERRVSRLVRS